LQLIANIEVNCENPGMNAAFEIRNLLSEELHVWIEPWCHPYRVPKGSILRLSYAASTEHPLHTEVTPDGIVVYTNSDHEPAAEVDGRAVAPDFS
jgi:hypothetical protein